MEERIVVTGGRPLNGSVKIPAAKNSVLPLFAASLLCTGEVRLQAVPRLADVEHCMALLRGVGCAARWESSDAVLSGPPANSTLPGQTAGQMRASILFCAPLLARLGRAETSLPGGCRIGARPIDLHLAGLAKMGAVELEAGEGRLVLTAPSGLHGAEITLRFPSVGATETLLLAAACARGRTILRGAAREPEIADLAAFLNRCGGCIEGAGSSTIRIEGRRGLSGCCFSPLPDRIFASTLACGCAAAGGRVFTGAYPALATDAAPLLAAAMLCADSESSIEDVIFERRFGCAEGFCRLGAQAGTAGRVLTIVPGGHLCGTVVEAPDLRGGAALVLAGLAARGTTVITHPAHIDRGYAGFTEILAGLGAQIRRESAPGNGSAKKPLQKNKFVLQSGQKDDTIQLYKYSIELFLCEKRRFTITYPMEDKSYGTHARRRNG